MKQLGLKSLIRVKKYKSYKGQQGKSAPIILNRKFKSDRPDQKWATDLTEFNVLGQKLYLSPIIDLFNGEIVTYQLSERPNFKQIIEMLKKSFKTIPDNTNLILHSDQGLAISNETVSANIIRKRNNTKYVQKRKLLGQTFVIEI